MVPVEGALLGTTHPFLAGKAAALALLCGGVAMAALPRSDAATPEELQWRALAVAPLSAGGRTGLRMAATQQVEPIEFAPDRPTVELAMTLGAGDSMRALLIRAGASHGDAARAAATIAATAPAIASATTVSVVLGPRSGASRPIQRVALRAGLGMNLQIVRDANVGLQLVKQPIPVDTRPLRVRGQAGDGLYWSLRAAGVSPQSAAEYLRALATEIDVGSEIGAGDRFDLVLASRRAATGERQVGQFSSGMKQRLLVARALLGRPRVLLLDEPTRGLDPLSARSLRTFLKDEICHRQGCTIVLATHNADEAFHLCDRVAILDRGRVLTIGPAQRLADQFAEERYRVWSRTDGQVTLDRLAARGLVLEAAAARRDEDGWLVRDVRVPGGHAGTARVLETLMADGVEIARFERVQPTLAELIERVQERARKAQDA